MLIIKRKYIKSQHDDGKPKFYIFGFVSVRSVVWMSFSLYSIEFHVHITPTIYILKNYPISLTSSLFGEF